MQCCPPAAHRCDATRREVMKRAAVSTVLAISVVLALAPVVAARGAHGGRATFGPARVHGRGSAEQVDVTGARPGVALTLVSHSGNALQSRRVDRLGALLFR